METESKGKIISNFNKSTSNIGLQSLTSEFDIGFCMIFSYFWLYCVLCIIIYNVQRGTYTNSKEWIEYLERIIIKNTKNSMLFYSKIVKFTETITMNIVKKMNNTNKYEYIEGRYIYLKKYGTTNPN